MTDFNVTSQLGRGITEDEVDTVFNDLRQYSPALTYEPDGNAVVILTIRDITTPASAIATSSVLLRTVGLGEARRQMVETTESFDAD